MLTLAVFSVASEGGHAASTVVGTPGWLYGTAWKKEATASLVASAIRHGVRAFDTANQPRHYNESLLGEALRTSGLGRADFFLQSKFTPAHFQDEDATPYNRAAPIGEQVAQSVAGSLAHLGVERLDSLLMHGHYDAFGDTLAAWRGFEAARGAGLVTSIGVSNFDAALLRRLAAAASEPPTIVQNRLRAAGGWDDEVRRWCAETGALYQGFSLLTANRHALKAPSVLRLARARAVEATEVLIRWARQRGIVVVTGPKAAAHIAANSELFGRPASDGALDEDELETVDALAASPYDGSSAVRVTFRSALPDAPIECLWVGNDGALVPQGTIEAKGRTLDVNTYHGHEFQCRLRESQRVLKRWVADAAVAAAGGGGRVSVTLDGQEDHQGAKVEL